jgi:hypothetical protein
MLAGTVPTSTRSAASKPTAHQRDALSSEACAVAVCDRLQTAGIQLPWHLQGQLASGCHWLLTVQTIKIEVKGTTSDGSDVVLTSNEVGLHEAEHPNNAFAIVRHIILHRNALFDRLGRYEPAATIAGFAIGPMTERAFPEITTAIAHLREVLGDQTYESLARKGETMTTAAMATYAYDQIDQARTELEHLS